jgi:hypothetical protein
MKQRSTSMVLKGLLIITCYLLLARLASSKVSIGKAYLTGEKTEHFLSKFSIGVGVGRLEAKFWVKNIYDNPRELTIFIYCDEDWPKAEQALTCRDKIKHSRRSERLIFQHHEHYVGENVYGRPNNVAQVFRLQLNLTMHIRTHYWYFTLADCTLEEFYHEVPIIYYNLELYNEPGDNHLPADEMGLPQLYRLNACIAVCSFVALVYMIVEKVNNSGSVHLVLIMLSAAILLNLLSTIFEIHHLSEYALDGIGSNFSDAMAAVTGAACDFIVTFLLISVSCGWTLTNSLPMDLTSFGFINQKIMSGGIFARLVEILKKPSNILSNFNLASFTLLMLFLFHVTLILWGRYYSDEFNKFHDFEHFPGKILMVFRTVCGIFFWFAATSTIRLQGNVGEMASFLTKFRLVGFAWFFCLPVCVLFAPLWAEYLRHWWITGGTMLLQSTAIVFFLFLFIGEKNSVYYRKSTVGMKNVDLNGNNFSNNINDTTVTSMSMNNADINAIASAGFFMGGIRSSVKAIKKARVHVD